MATVLECNPQDALGIWRQDGCVLSLPMMIFLPLRTVDPDQTEHYVGSGLDPNC